MSHFISSQTAAIAAAPSAPGAESERPGTGRGVPGTAGAGSEFNRVFAAQKGPPESVSNAYPARKQGYKSVLNQVDNPSKSGHLSVQDLAQAALQSSGLTQAQYFSVSTETPQNTAFAGARAGPASARAVPAGPLFMAAAGQAPVESSGANLPPDGRELPQLPATSGVAAGAKAAPDLVSLQRTSALNPQAPTSLEFGGAAAQRVKHSADAPPGAVTHSDAQTHTAAAQPLERALRADQLMQMAAVRQSVAEGAAAPQASVAAPDSGRIVAAPAMAELPVMQSGATSAETLSQRGVGNSASTFDLRNESPGLRVGLRVPQQYLSSDLSGQQRTMAGASDGVFAGAPDLQAQIGTDSRALQMIAGVNVRRNDSRNTEPSAPVTAAPLHADTSAALRSTGTAAGAAQAFADSAAPQSAVSQQIGSQLVAMRLDGQSVAKLQLQPAELGALEIRISMQDEGAVVSINAQQQGTRDLIEASLPRLRELFENSGSQLLDVDVSGSDSSMSDDSTYDQQATNAAAESAPLSAAESQPHSEVRTPPASARLLDMWV